MSGEEQQAEQKDENVPLVRKTNGFKVVDKVAGTKDARTKGSCGLIARFQKAPQAKHVRVIRY